MRTQALVVALAVLVLAAAAFLTTRAERRPGAARPVAERAAVSEPNELDDVRAARPNIADRPDPAGESVESARIPAIGEATATLVVRVVDLDEGARGAPVFGERVQARLTGAASAQVPVAGSVGALGEMPQTDVDGEATFRLPPGDYVVANARRDAEVAVSLEDGEERVVTLELSAMTRALAIRVVRADNGAPLEGVRAEWRGSKHVATSDADGRLLSRVWRSGGDRGELTREGFASAELVIGTGAAAEELRVAMRPAAALVGGVRSLSGQPRAGVVLIVRADVPRTLAGSPGGAESVERVWSARTASDGTYGIAGLVSGVPLQLEPHAPSDTGPLRRELMLAPFEERILDLQLGGGARVHGRLLASDLTPHVQAAVRLVPVVEGPEHAELAASLTSKGELVITDTNGAFSFRGVHAGTWLVAPDAGTLASPRELRLGEREGEVELDLVAAEPFYVSGTCVDADGQPRGSVALVGRSANGLQRRAVTGPDGSFRMGPFAAGEAEITVEPGFQARVLALVEPVVVKAGAEGVVVRVEDRGEQALRLR